MFFFDFIFLNIGFLSLTLLVVFFYLLGCLVSSTNNQGFLGWSFCFFFLNTIVLVFFGVELFGSIIFLSEVIVFFYIFVVNLISPNQSSFVNPNLFFLFFLFFFILSAPTYNSFYNYVFNFWYFNIYSLNNDVFGVFYFFYFGNPAVIIFIGLLLTVCTYFICSVTIFMHSSYHSFKKKSLLSDQFFQNNQNNSYQLNNNPFIFGNFFFNGR